MADHQQPANSFWLSEGNAFPHASTVLPTHTVHTAVIGGGITGVSALYWLRKFGVEDVILLERGGLANGATGRNGGHCWPGIVSGLVDASARYGDDKARALYQYTIDTAEAMKKFMREWDQHFNTQSSDPEIIARFCSAKFPGGVLLAEKPEDVKQLHLEYEALVRLGFQKYVELWDEATCYAKTKSRDFKAGIFHKFSGQVWPAKLVMAIAEAAHRLGGCSVFTNTNVESVARDRPESSDSVFVIKTSRGIVKAKHVIYAVNAWTGELIPSLNDVITPVRGQVILTAPTEKQVWPFAFWSWDSWEYLIQRPDNRIVLGGMRYKSKTMDVNTRDHTTINSDVSRGLRSYLVQKFPEVFNKDGSREAVDVEYEWTGIMAFTKDNLPLIGPLPNQDRYTNKEYIAGCFTGHGMPVAFTAAKNVAEMIAKRPSDTFIDLYLPSRFFNASTANKNSRNVQQQIHARL